MSISTTGWRGLLAVAATCVFVGACTGDGRHGWGGGNDDRGNRYDRSDRDSDGGGHDRADHSAGRYRRDRRPDRRSAPGCSRRRCGSLR